VEYVEDVLSHGYPTYSGSHARVPLCHDSLTPVTRNPFVFIDEDSCVGCGNCWNVAGRTFVATGTGRARTADQEGEEYGVVLQAVGTCPVDCMHFVGLRERRELETARDQGDGRGDHRHVGWRGNGTPLHVAGVDSDANHKSSWFHVLKSECSMNGKHCPRKGCYNCPHFHELGGNTFWKELFRGEERVRYEHARRIVEGKRIIVEL